MKPQTQTTAPSVAHTPVPWKVIGAIQDHGANPKRIEIRLVATSYYSCEGTPSVSVRGEHASGNAQFIVQAVNSHAALVEACEAACEAMCQATIVRDLTLEEMADLREQLSAALLLAKGEAV